MSDTRMIIWVLEASSVVRNTSSETPKPSSEMLGAPGVILEGSSGTLEASFGLQQTSSEKLEALYAMPEASCKRLEA